MSHKVSQEGINHLRRCVENYLDRRIVTPADYDYLSMQISERVRKQVSTTTLKRVWGYVCDKGEDYKPGRYTASALAALVGYRDYEDFISAYNDGEIQSAEYSGESLPVTNLLMGERVELQWIPERRCLLEFLGGNLFRVLESRNSKLMEADLVECAIFVQHAPAYFSRVIRNGYPGACYIAGSRTGIRWKLIAADEAHSAE